MIKKTAIIILIIAVLAGFSISAVRIIMRGSVRSEKTEEEKRMSELLESATNMGTYFSDISIRVGEKVSAKELLESSLDSPVSVGSNLPLVNLSKCNIYFDSGKTSEQILSPGKKSFTIIASSAATNRDYVYFVDFEADEALVTTIPVTCEVTSSTNRITTAPPKVIYEEKPKNPVTTVPKKTSTAVTTISVSTVSASSTEITVDTPVTQPPVTDPPQDEPVTQPPAETEAPPEPEAPPETVAPPDDPPPAPEAPPAENPESQTPNEEQ